MLIGLKDKLYVFGGLVVIGVVLWMTGELVFGPGVVITAFVAFMTEAVPALLITRRKGKQVKDVEVVTLRKGDFVVRSILPEIEKANRIDLLGNVLSDLFGGGERRILEVLRKRDDCSAVQIRVCVYAPRNDNSILRQRAKDEANINIRSPEQQLLHLIALGNDVYQVIRDLKITYKYNIELRYVCDTYILNSIIRVGTKMVVVDYLHQTGTNSPVFVLRPGEVQDAYRGEFDKIWGMATQIDLGTK